MRAIANYTQKKSQPVEYMATNTSDSWKRRGIKPKFHVSEQGSN